MFGRPQIWPEYFPGGGGGWGTTAYQWQGYQGGNYNPQGGGTSQNEAPPVVTIATGATTGVPIQQDPAVTQPTVEQSSDFGKWILIGVLVWAFLG